MPADTNSGIETWVYVRVLNRSAWSKHEGNPTWGSRSNFSRCSPAALGPESAAAQRYGPDTDTDSRCQEGIHFQRLWGVRRLLLQHTPTTLQRVLYRHEKLGTV